MLCMQIPSYFKVRRDRLMKANSGAAFVLPAAVELNRNPDVSFPFRQESHFFYLTGFDEPDAWLVLAPAGSKAGDYRMTLFVRRRDPEKEMWEGERYGVDRAKSVFGADDCYPIDELDQKLPELLKDADRICYRIAQNTVNDARVLTAMEKVRRSLGRSGMGLRAIHDPIDALGEMRIYKGEEEIGFLREACRISALAHKTAMQEVRPGMNEFEVEALIDYTFRKNGCTRVGYESIIAGGRNSTCLHYRANNEPLKEGDLLLIDAGGEYQYYTADITRTFPVGKSFSAAQAKAYDLVLQAQKEAIALAKPGSSMRQIHDRACEVITEGLLSMGLLKGKKEDLIKESKFRRFYPHGTGHWLGMDVHDVGLYLKNGEPRPLEAGMVFTIEPGFYVQPTDTEAPAEFANIGIRIEDNILITPEGHENMTLGAPKERSEIEALRP